MSYNYNFGAYPQNYFCLPFTDGILIYNFGNRDQRKEIAQLKKTFVFLPTSFKNLEVNSEENVILLRRNLDNYYI